jgi:predicted ATPase
MNSQANDSLFKHGATWVRADFHLHTKEDKEFIYADDENVYNSNYVAALEQEGIKLGVITNHNKFDIGEFRGLRSTAKKKGIGLLPGVELSINDGANGIHTLIVFSDAWLEDGKDYINQFLQVAFDGKLPQDYENKNGRTTLSLPEIIKKLEECYRKYQRDSFLIFAHVEQSSGLWNELDGGRLEELGKDALFRRRTLGFQKVRTYDGAGKERPCRTKVQGWLKDWYPAEVEGSDPKSIDGADNGIGKGEACYVKLGELNFEAVKFALADWQNRVAKEIPQHKASHIRSIRFEGGILNGERLCFSPELNTLIGIRGSGKSSILEAVRYVLNIPFGDKAQDTRYKEDAVRHLLGSGGKAIIEARDGYGQEFTVSRILGEMPNVYLGGKLQPGVSIRETVLRRPIYFGQKDLSSTGEGFEKDLVEKLVGEKLLAVRLKITEQQQRLRDVVKAYEGLKNIGEQKKEYQSQLADAEFRLKKFREYGLEEKLEKISGFQRDAQTIKRTNEKVGEFIDGLRGFIAEFEDDLKNARSYDSNQNKEFFKEYFAEYALLLKEFEKLPNIIQSSRAIKERLDGKQGEFAQRLENLREEFAQIKRNLAEELKQAGATELQTDDFLQQQQRKNKAEQMLSVFEKQEKLKDSVWESLLGMMDALNELWREEFNLVKGELERVNGRHQAFKIEAKFKGDKDAAFEFMQQLFRGSAIRESTLRGVFDEYAGQGGFGGLFKDWSHAREKFGARPDVFERFFFEHLADFLTYQIPNKFSILYHGRGLKRHSIGQRASALIIYILSQKENDVIIIDQPEDDLDNQTIYEDVIKLVQEMKKNTQFIFATHNANFPVLGDAEQIIVCQYQDEIIKANCGSIDHGTIQKEIIGIMEGGETAFNKRKEIYNLWK